MKKLFLIFILFCTISSAFGIELRKNKRPSLFVSPINPLVTQGFDNTLENFERFKCGQRIYFLIYVPKGFKSDYIRYQIVKQEDKAHIGGYTRIRNITKRVSDKNQFVDYFVLHEKGKYYLQVFDITNLHQWLAMTYFEVADE